MIDYLISFVTNKSVALDIAAGNGQVAHKLSPFFETVNAIDISQSQSDNAIPGANIKYKIAAAKILLSKIKSFI